MKKIKLLGTIILCIFFMYSTTSCVLLLKKDNGKHKGWDKSQNSPNNGNSEKQKGKHKK